MSSTWLMANNDSYILLEKMYTAVAMTAHQNFITHPQGG